MPTDGAYHPGACVPLRIDATDAGTVRVRAPDALGIEFEAPGRGAVVVPWVIWRTTPGEIEVTVNERKQTLQVSPRPLGAPIEAPDAASKAVLNLTGPLDRFGGINPHAYAPTYDFSPGRPFSQRKQIAVWAMVSLLGLAALSLTPRKHRAIAMLGGAVLLCGAIAWSVPPELERRAVVVRASGWTDTWVYHAVPPGERTGQPIEGAVFVVARSLGELHEIDPVLHIDPAGIPRVLEATSPESGSWAYVIRNDCPAPLDGKPWASPMFAIRLYGQAGTVGADGVIELKSAGTP